jgi:hypothetical protein
MTTRRQFLRTAHKGLSMPFLFWPIAICILALIVLATGGYEDVD